MLAKVRLYIKFDEIRLYRINVHGDGYSPNLPFMLGINRSLHPYRSGKNMDLPLIIIGSGVAGLTAGCYTRMNGYDTTILEMTDTTGGLCTSWKRKGYLFDGSAAGLAGAAPGNPLYQLWEDIGVAKCCTLHFGGNFDPIHLPDGKVVTVYSNIDRLERHLLDLFPEDDRRNSIGITPRYPIFRCVRLGSGKGWHHHFHNHSTQSARDH